MKKTILLLASIALLAAACNSSQTTQTSPSPSPSAEVQNDSQAKVDAAANALISGVDSEQLTVSQSDDSVINSDKSIINSYDGAANANY